jgi:hypothetical protein
VRTVRLLGCIALIVCGLGTSSAAATEFEGELYPVEIIGEETGSHVFTVDGGTITCADASFTGGFEEATETIVVDPVFSKCTALGFAEATAKAEGCQFQFYAGEELEEEGDYKGTADLLCPAGKAMVFVAGTCEVQIGAQTGLSTLQYDENPAAEPPDITVEANLSKIKYNKTKDGIGCPLSGTGAKEDGTYVGNALVGGSTYDIETEESEEVGVAIDQAGNTKLCKKAPVNKACPANEEWAASTPFEASADAKVQGPVKLTIGEGGKFPAIKNVVTCEKSLVKATSEAALGTPSLPMKDVEITFTVTECKTTKNNGCNVVSMTNAPAKGYVRSTGMSPGNGYLYTPFTLSIACAGEFSCKYNSNNYPMYITGANPAGLKHLGAQLAVTKVGEPGCYDNLSLGGKYAVTKPQPLWVTE